MEPLLIRPFRHIGHGELELLVLARDEAGTHWIFDLPASDGRVYPPAHAPRLFGGQSALLDALDFFDTMVALRQPISAEPLREMAHYQESLQRVIGLPGEPPLGRNTLGDLVAPPEQDSGAAIGGPGVAWLVERYPRAAAPGWFVTLAGGQVRWHGSIPGSMRALQRALRAPWSELARARGSLIVEARIGNDGTVWLIDLVRIGRFGPEQPLAERRLALGEVATAIGSHLLRFPETLPGGFAGGDTQVMLRRLDAAYDPSDPRAGRVLLT